LIKTEEVGEFSCAKSADALACTFVEGRVNHLLLLLLERQNSIFYGVGNNNTANLDRESLTNAMSSTVSL
jgi:hypothetical protein